MLPWEILAQEQTADGLLELRRRSAHDYLITIKGRILMASATHRSEVELAKLGCEHLRGVPAARVLVSGLGMGFTLRAALDCVDADASVDVAELNAVVLGWCRGPLLELTAGAALDPRVQLEHNDVSKVIARAATQGPRYDAIVLDMYEGPQSRVPADEPLYGAAAMRRVRQALSERGVLTVWCEHQSVGYEKALKDAGLRFELQRVGRGARMFLVYRAWRDPSADGKSVQANAPQPRTARATKAPLPKSRQAKTTPAKAAQSKPLRAKPADSEPRARPRDDGARPPSRRPR